MTLKCIDPSIKYIKQARARCPFCLQLNMIVVIDGRYQNGFNGTELCFHNAGYINGLIYFQSDGGDGNDEAAE